MGNSLVTELPCMGDDRHVRPSWDTVSESGLSAVNFLQKSMSDWWQPPSEPPADVQKPLARQFEQNNYVLRHQVYKLEHGSVDQINFRKLGENNSSPKYFRIDDSPPLEFEKMVLNGPIQPYMNDSYYASDKENDTFSSN